MNVDKVEQTAQMYLIAASITLLVAQLVSGIADDKQRAIEDRLISAIDVEIRSLISGLIANTDSVI